MYILFCKSVEFCNVAVAGSKPISTKTRENTAVNLLSFDHFFSAYFLLKLHIIHKMATKKRILHNYSLFEKTAFLSVQYGSPCLVRTLGANARCYR